MSDFNWTCPYCNRDVTISAERRTTERHTNYINNAVGGCTLTSTFIVCPNQQCRKYTLTCQLNENLNLNSTKPLGKILMSWKLLPPSNAKIFPDYIPQAILADYKEACLIRELSPKASATLARRCLQGILRDFWDVKPGNLFTELREIKEKIDPFTWGAIDAVRTVGNIGAHMEKDIDLIVDVDPGEAKLLINLIEILLKDWYITKEERRIHLLSITEMAEEKEEQRKGNK